LAPEYTKLYPEVLVVLIQASCPEKHIYQKAEGHPIQYPQNPKRPGINGDRLIAIFAAVIVNGSNLSVTVTCSTGFELAMQFEDFDEFGEQQRLPDDAYRNR